MSSPLITHVIPTLAPYGAERIALELVARLPARGFRTRLIVLFGEGALTQELHSRHIQWTSVVPSRAASRVELFQTLRQTLFADATQASAVIHTHLFGSDFWTAATWRLEHLFRGPVGVHHPAFLSTAHNVDADDSIPRHMARRWSMRHMDSVVAISEEVAQYVRKDFGVHTDRLSVLPNGIDLARVIPRGSHPFHAVPQLLMVGRLETQKGHATVIEALAGVTAPWRLDIVGSGALARSLKELTERLGIASRVQFLGERSDVPQLMAGADLFLFPSRWEGMGLALVEALVAGVPVLASDLPAIRECGVPRESLVPAESINAWCDAIAATLARPAPALDRAARLAGSARKRYDIEAMVDKYAALYRTLLPS